MSDPLDFAEQEDEAMPSAPDIDPDIATLKERMEAAMLEAQRGCALPISLGDWSRDLAIRIGETYPRHKFSWLRGTIYLDDHPPQSAHRAMGRVVDSATYRYSPESLCDGERNVDFGEDLLRAPDLVYSLTHATSAPTVIEINWAHESITRLEAQVHTAAASGYNAIAIKGWLDGQSGNQATRDVDLTHSYDELSSLTSILLITKLAGSHEMRAWRLGDKARDAKLGQPAVEMSGVVAWLPLKWFGDQEGSTFPVSLRAIGDAIVLSLMLERPLDRETIRNFRQVSRARCATDAIEAIHSNQLLTAEERQHLLARTKSK